MMVSVFVENKANSEKEGKQKNSKTAEITPRKVNTTPDKGWRIGDVRGAEACGDCLTCEDSKSMW